MDRRAVLVGFSRPVSAEALDRLERRWGGLVLLAGVLLGALHTGFTAGFDFAVYWRAAAAVAAGGSAYHTGGGAALGRDIVYLYPPPLAHLLAPFTAVVPETVALLVFSLAGALALLAALRLTDGAWHRWPRIAAAVSVAWYGAFLGQAAPFVAAGTILALGARRDSLRGLGLAVAALLKVTPAALGIALVLDRRPRAIAVAAAVTLAALPLGGIAEWGRFLAVLAGTATGDAARTWALVSPLRVSPALWLVAAAAVAVVLVAAGRRPDARDLRLAAIGLALVALPPVAEPHWLLFAAAPVAMAATRHAWARTAFAALVVASLLPLAVGTTALALVEVATLAGLAALSLRGQDASTVGQPASMARHWRG